MGLDIMYKGFIIYFIGYRTLKIQTYWVVRPGKQTTSIHINKLKFKCDKIVTDY
jgi:hypothetical protein